MKSFLAYVRERLFAGLFFLIPVVVLLLLGRQLLLAIAKLLHPIASRLPTLGLRGPAADYFLAAMSLVVVAFVVGVVASTSVGRSVGQVMERFALARIPGFTLFKSFLRGSEASGVQVLFVTLDDAWLFGFLIEELPDGMLAVFVPAVPTPTSGSLYFFTEQQVRRTDISVREAVRCLTRLGVGATALVNRRLTAKP